MSETGIVTISGQSIEESGEDNSGNTGWMPRVLAEARMQRDVAQAALDKANRDNDALRAELRKEKARADRLDALYRAAERSIKWFLDERAVKALVDGGAGYYPEDEEE